jgi:amino acid transporter
MSMATIGIGPFVHKVAYGAGMAFSASCFTALGMLVGHAGEATLPVLLGGGLLMLVIVAAVSELAALFPSAVGLRVYTRAGLGESASLAAVLLYLVLVLLVAGLEMRIFSAVLATVWPGLNPLLLTFAIFAAIVATQWRGWQTSALAQTALVLLLLAAVLALVGGGVLRPLPVAKTLPTGDLASATVIGLFLFASVEWVTTLQLRHPADARALPRVLLVACALLLVLFMVTGQAIVGLARAGIAFDPALPQQALAAAWPALWGSVLLLLVTGTAVLSTCHAGLTCAGRLVYMLGREGHLPRVLCRSNAAGVPTAALLAVTLASFGAVAAVMQLASLDGLAEACALAICTVYVFYLVSAARLRRGARQPAWPALRLPRWVLWGVAGSLVAVMAATAVEAQRSGHLPLALLPWLTAAIGVAAMQWRAARPQRSSRLSMQPLERSL